MKALLIPAAAAALLAGCSTWDQPYASSYPGTGVYAPSAPYATMGGYPYGGTVAPAAAPYGAYPRVDAYGRQYRDRDGDGVPNRNDADRDGDGVPNAYDARPNNPSRR